MARDDGSVISVACTEKSGRYAPAAILMDETTTMSYLGTHVM